MGQISYVVVFPTIFSSGMYPQLISNIKKILNTRNQPFKSIKRDHDVIIIDANDPVFASSSINLLFGIKKISIARKVSNNFDDIVSNITSIGGNLLLKGDRFLVKVDGVSKGFLPKDVELGATSKIIEKKSQLGAKPGTEQNYDKLLYCHLTKKNAYISIFSDNGMGGIPFGINNAICCIYDELSAIACYETMRQGFNPKIIVCYTNKSKLISLAKMINRILPRMLKENVTIEVFHIKKPAINIILEILLYCAKLYHIPHVSVPISYAFGIELVDDIMNKIFECEKIPILPINEFTLDMDAQELLIKKYSTTHSIYKGDIDIDNIFKSRRIIDVKVGPNNIHDFLDSFKDRI